MKPGPLLKRLQDGHLQNVRFRDVERLIESLGFLLERVRGDHHIYKHPRATERLNLQSLRGEAKPYQLRQLVELVAQYDLKPGEKS